MTTAIVTNIQGFSIHDGPGIRTVVFFKGCPLSCLWCANPECISRKPAIGFIKTHCHHCGKCFEACPINAIQPGENTYRIKQDLCDTCGECVNACSYEALVRYGEPMTVEEVWDKVKRDKMFYDSSGGGVTVSGGEPLLTPRFVNALFTLCKSEEIGTCVETCGFVSQAALELVLPVTDLFLFDLKHMDPEIHQKTTGQSNEVILSNVRFLIQQNVDICFRHPLIPGVNDSPDHIQQIADFINGLGESAPNLELMPYHRIGSDKYKALDLTYTLTETAAMPMEAVEAIQNMYIERGVNCAIST